MGFQSHGFPKSRVSKGDSVPFGGVFRGKATKSPSAEGEILLRPQAYLEALRKGEFRNCVAKEGRPAREGVLNNGKAVAFVQRKGNYAPFGNPRFGSCYFY